MPNILLFLFLMIGFLISIRKNRIYLLCITQINSRCGCIIFTHLLSSTTIALGAWNLTEKSTIFPFIIVFTGVFMANHPFANKILIFTMQYKWHLLIIPLISIIVWNINPFPFLLLLFLLATATRFYCPLG